MYFTFNIKIIGNVSQMNYHLFNYSPDGASCVIESNKNAPNRIELLKASVLFYMVNVWDILTLFNYIYTQKLIMFFKY